MQDITPEKVIFEVLNPEDTSISSVTPIVSILLLVESLLILSLKVTSTVLFTMCHGL